MERSKKRKPWFRVRNIILAKLLVAALLVSVAAVISYRAVPGPPIDFPGQFRALTLSRQPAAGDDGFPAFERATQIWSEAERRAMSEAGPQPADFPARTVWAVLPADLDEPDMHEGVRKQTIAALDYAEAAGLFRELDAVAAAARIAWPVPESPLFANPKPEELIARSRSLLRVCVGRMHLAAERGDWDEFTRAFGQAVAIGRVASRSGSMYSRLVSIAIDAAAAGTVRRAVVAHDDMPEAALVRILALMDATSHAPFADAFESERLGLLEFIQGAFTDDGHGDGVAIPAKFRVRAGARTGPVAERWQFSDSFAVFALPSKRVTVGKVEELFAGMKEWAAAAPGERDAVAFDPRAWPDTLPDGISYIGIVVEAHVKAVAAEDQIRSVWQGTRLLLAVEIHRRRHGDVPESLGSLVPGVLSEIPDDWFSPGGFRYVRTGAGEYVLYSVGANGRDDGGVHADPEGAAYNPVRPLGDFRFNVEKGP